MEQQGPLSAMEIAIANLIDHPELQPEAIKATMAKLRDLRPVVNQVEVSIKQTQQSLNQLFENRAKLSGSFETLLQLVEESMPKETLEQYGKQLIQETKNVQ